MSQMCLLCVPMKRINKINATCHVSHTYGGVFRCLLHLLHLSFWAKSVAPIYRLMVPAGGVSLYLLSFINLFPLFKPQDGRVALPVATAKSLFEEHVHCFKERLSLGGFCGLSLLLHCVNFPSSSLGFLTYVSYDGC